MRAFDGEVAIAVAPFYLARMLQRTLPAGFIAPCLPTKTDKLPSGSQWLHEIKHDGFRIIARGVIRLRSARPHSRASVTKASPGIRFNEHMEGDGPTVFAHACKLGLEGIVSKRKDFSVAIRALPDLCLVILS